MGSNRERNGIRMTDQSSDQINELAKFIMERIPGEPSRSEGAVDTAIRLLGAVYPVNQCNEWVEVVDADPRKRDGSSWSVRCNLERGDHLHAARIKWLTD